MKIVRTIPDLRLAVAAGPEKSAVPPKRLSWGIEHVERPKTIGFVPTMGWFHEGHLSLMRRARAECDIAVVSLFVNPTQFNDPRDLKAYPRDEPRDAALAETEGVDILFAPDATEIYPTGYSTSVTVGKITAPLEGLMRGSSHFDGVATVVTKLFNIVRPTAAYFGQKDAQQVLVIKKLVRDLNLAVRVEVCPTIREFDGLAMSSRNVRLRPDDRARALTLHKALQLALGVIANGERRRATVEAAARNLMETAGVEPEYFAAVRADTLEPSETLLGDVLLAVAARVGEVRLIDNEIVKIP